MARFCKGSDCKKRASYGRIGSKLTEFCSPCVKKLKLEGYSDIVNGNCVECKTARPSYGRDDIDPRPTHCKKCITDLKLEGYSNIVNPKCKECKAAQPNFGRDGIDPRPTHCGSCIKDLKLDGYSDIKHPKCVECKAAIPSFGRVGIDLRPTHCKKCVTYLRLEGYSNIVHRKCKECKAPRPFFGRDGIDTRPTHCGKCVTDLKLEGYSDIISQKCVACKIVRPCYGRDGIDPRPTHCAGCITNLKLEGYSDIKSRKCVACKAAQPSFGRDDIDPRPTHCAGCVTDLKLDGYSDIRNRKCVECKAAQPHFGRPGIDPRPTHCGKCIKDLEGYENIIHKTCDYCHAVQCSKRVKTFPHCYSCYYTHLHPEEKPTILIRIKENRFVKDLKPLLRELCKGKDYKVTFNKTVRGGCSGKKPDIMIDCLTFVIFIELDEHQHTRGYSCENKRMMELFEDVGRRPIIVLRVNPDEYRDKSRVRHAGCWTYISPSRLQVNEELWAARLEPVKSAIIEAVQTPVDPALMRELDIRYFWYNESPSGSDSE